MTDDPLGFVPSKSASLKAVPLTLDDCLIPDWPAPSNVRAWVTTRRGGVSRPPFDTLNLGLHTGDERDDVLANRAALGRLAGARLAWLEQVHGTAVADAAEVLRAGQPLRADASVTSEPGIACIVMIADCLPVLFCDARGRAVGAAHAGWRGLSAGVLEKTAQAVARRAGEGAVVHAWLGPAIGPNAFEVGRDVFDAFVDGAPAAERETTAAAFTAHGSAPQKYLADLHALARIRLRRAGVTSVAGTQACTVSDPARFYSYRRDGATGRFAALVWLAGQAISG
ncbi:peptidoglycan editing factor PgeF [Pararobbsia alpina]|nr:peptidoglycan editing factor PgeF [Pararobbsia alpina]